MIKSSENVKIAGIRASFEIFSRQKF